MSENGKGSDWRFRPEKEQHDIYDLHRATLREPPEPREGLERPPWWLWVISVLLIFWAGFYLGRYGGVFGPEVHLLQKGEHMETGAAKGPEESGGGQQVAKVSGSEVYGNVCAACHQSKGEGLPGSFPPLAGSSWLLKDPETPIRIVLHGLKGPIEVAGQTYNGVMPAWGEKLSDDEIAAVLTYVRSSWGNSADEVKTDLVKKIRESTSDHSEHWTAEELSGLR